MCPARLTHAPDSISHLPVGFLTRPLDHNVDYEQNFHYQADRDQGGDLRHGSRSGQG